MKVPSKIVGNRKRASNSQNAKHKPRKAKLKSSLMLKKKNYSEWKV
jgi:hypothetical protein